MPRAAREPGARRAARRLDPLRQLAGRRAGRGARRRRRTGATARWRAPSSPRSRPEASPERSGTAAGSGAARRSTATSSPSSSSGCCSHRSVLHEEPGAARRRSSSPPGSPSARRPSRCSRRSTSLAPGSGAESLTWVTTAEAAGSAVGSALAGVLVDATSASGRRSRSRRLVPAARRRSPASRSRRTPAADSPPRGVGSTIRARMRLQRRFPRLQGLARGRARDPRAPARRRPRRGGAGDAADVAVINSCCVTNEAVAKSRKAAARAARTHGRVYLTGCAANLGGDAFAGLPANVTVVARRAEDTAAFVAGDVGAIGCVQADARLDRVRAFVKIQDGCSFSCGFCVIPLVRGASRSRQRRRGARRDRAAGSRRATARSSSPASTSAASATATPATTCRASCARPARRPGSTGCASARSRSTTSTTSSSPRCARRRPSSRHLHVPAPVRRRRRAARDAAPLLDRDLPAPARAARRRVQPDERRDRRLPGRGRGGVRSDARARSSAPG